ncbi:hypothetical protein HRbin11_02224 [bacterium HR11]|nr:hypothetical protein HRbin11_02224 [bacterium HR11]
MTRPDIRVLEALPPAWAHVRRVLFQPFDIGRWLILGFLSFLQSLGEGGFNVNLPSFSGPERAEPVDRKVLQEVLRWVSEHWPLLMGICGVLLVLGVGLVLLLMWLSARGTFAYLDCIVTNRAEVRRPWRAHRAIANSYFAFRVVVGLVTLAVLVAITVPVVVLVAGRLRAREGLRAGIREYGMRDAGCEPWAVPQGPPRPISPSPHGAGSLDRWAHWRSVRNEEGEGASGDSSLLVALIVWAVLLFLVVLASVVLNVLLVDFVAPVQYLTKVGAFEALKAVWGLVTSHVGVFLLYLIVRLALALAVGCGIFVLGCLTCCVFFCMTAIPVVSQTVLQPVYALFRAFPLFVLRQFGPAWDVFAPTTSDAPSGPVPPTV